MATLNKFNILTEDLAKAVHDFSTHTFKVLLSNTLPVATNSTKADITEISPGGGYSAGGFTVTVTVSRAAGVTKISIADKTFTAAGGSVGPFRYAVLYNDSSTGDKLIGWYDKGSSITLADTETFNIDFDGTNGVMTIT